MVPHRATQHNGTSSPDQEHLITRVRGCHGRGQARRCRGKPRRKRVLALSRVAKPGFGDASYASGKRCGKSKRITSNYLTSIGRKHLSLDHLQVPELKLPAFVFVSRLHNVRKDIDVVLEWYSGPPEAVSVFPNDESAPLSLELQLKIEDEFRSREQVKVADLPDIFASGMVLCQR